MKTLSIVAITAFAFLGLGNFASAQAPVFQVNTTSFRFFRAGENPPPIFIPPMPIRLIYNRLRETGENKLVNECSPDGARGENQSPGLTFEAARGADGLLFLDIALFTTHRDRLVALAATSHLPAMYGYREMVEAGGLMSYGVSFPDMYRRAATYLDKILKGAKPADLPVEEPTKFEFVINTRTAEALGLTIPRPLAMIADQMIE